MNRLSAHLGYLYTELPLADRITAAAKDGFTAVEHPAPYAIPAAEMRTRITDLGMTFSQITSGMGDAAQGEKGLAALAGRETEFRAGFMRALDYAVEVGIPFVHPMAGVPGNAPDWQQTYHTNINWALDQVKGHAQNLLVEAITIPGYAMSNLDDAVALQEMAGDQLKLLFDSYHAAKLGVNASAWISQHGHRIGHVHIADYPGRHEPGTGTLDFNALRGALRTCGYQGAIGFEYIPKCSTLEGSVFLSEWAEFSSARITTGE